MNNLILALVTACLATTAFAKPPDINYDRFKNRTELSVKVDVPTHGSGFQSDSVWIEAIVKAGKLDLLRFDFWHGADAWKYLNCHDISFLVDGKPFEPAGTDFGSQMSGSLTIEIVYVALTREQLAAWAAAQKIEFRVCRDEHTFDATFMQDIKDFGPALDQALKGESTDAPPASGS